MGVLKTKSYLEDFPNLSKIQNDVVFNVSNSSEIPYYFRLRDPDLEKFQSHLSLNFFLRFPSSKDNNIM